MGSMQSGVSSRPVARGGHVDTATRRRRPDARRPEPVGGSPHPRPGIPGGSDTSRHRDRTGSVARPSSYLRADRRTGFPALIGNRVAYRSTMICSACGTTNPDGARFCLQCGSPLAATQGPASPLDSYLPPGLLTKLEAARAGRAMAGERRIVTMLFCDVVGSTAMAERLDPETGTEVMNEGFERLIAPVYRYEGTLARLMGDAIFAFFGAPIAHEDDPERAVAAGLGIVDAIRAYREERRGQLASGLDVRVGINTGPVVVGEVGSDLRVEYTAMGDAVNVAARMEQTAEPGTVQITAETARLVREAFELGPRLDV